MTARDDLAVLYERVIIGEEPHSHAYPMAIRQSLYHLDAIARMATHPETAPVVFAWLIEVGVLEQAGWVAFDGDEYHQFHDSSPEDRHRPSPGLCPVYAAAMDHERASSL